MERVKEILTTKDITSKSYAIYRLHNTYKNVNNQQEIRKLYNSEEPDVEKIGTIHDISLLGAIGHTKNLLIGFLTRSDKFGCHFYENNKYEISFEHCTEGIDHSLVVMNAYNLSTGQQVVMEALVVLHTT